MEKVTVTAKEQRVFELRTLGKTYREIGEAVGVTPTRVRQIFIKVQRKIASKQKAQLFIDWRVKYDFDLLVPMIDQIKEIAKNDGQG